MVIKLLRLRNHPELPVMVGASEPLQGLRPVFWPGHEGLGLLEPEDEAIEPDREHAVDFIVRKVMENPGEIHLVAVGPLTNVAMAFLREPQLSERLAHLTIMAGVIRGRLTSNCRTSSTTCGAILRQHMWFSPPALP